MFSTHYIHKLSVAKKPFRDFCFYFLLADVVMTVASYYSFKYLDTNEISYSYLHYLPTSTTDIALKICFFLIFGFFLKRLIKD
ncbi:hypothetical protein [Bacteriovorax sp. Seq25_V]|uniref:hypothetical protein n=1 Tax=Bacteriovorax sp. Seq25_V TaxID=1201288 RepID=UPI000389F952|nr:hypothetical protein [Bacteriovorax sp. Seq25_V]EQC45629.1 hypothetical protein M900_2292 [Bacteriovorax sp. Seq25_V]